MARKYQAHNPESLDALLDTLAYFQASAPTFVDWIGYFPEQDLKTSFGALNEGLSRLSGQLGEELYRKLAALSDQMRACFEADPEEKTGETRQGYKLLHEMEDLIEARIAQG